VTVAALVHTYGAAAVAAFITLEGMGLPLPGELILLTAGALAAQGDFGIAGIAIAAWIGTIAGGTGGYWIGRVGGAPFLRRYGRWIGVDAGREAAAREFFFRHGAQTIIIARFVAILRMLAGLVAGSVGMPFGLFSLCNAFGGLLWSATFATLGYYFGRHLHVLEHYLRGGSFGLLLILLVAGMIIWYHRRRRGMEHPRI
jgi:membrane protein DedA with SNARE-associated domain